MLSTPWHAPVFRATLDMADVEWLKDNRLGGDIVFPASGYVAMAIEAAYQSYHGSQHTKAAASVRKLGYRLRNVKFVKALVLKSGRTKKLMLTLAPHPGTGDVRQHFRILSLQEDVSHEHCKGMIRVELEAPPGKKINLS